MDPGSHVEFQISTKKHKSGRGPSNEHFWQVGSNLFSGLREEDLNVKS